MSQSSQSVFSTTRYRVNNYNYFWIPVAGPHLGGILGAVLYELFIGIHLPDPDASQLNKSKDWYG